MDALEAGPGTGAGNGRAWRQGLAQTGAVGCQGQVSCCGARSGLLETRPLVGLVREPAPCPSSQIQGTSCRVAGEMHRQSALG